MCSADPGMTVMSQSRGQSRLGGPHRGKEPYKIKGLAFFPAAVQPSLFLFA